MNDQAVALLLGAQNADGGWGAVKDRRSNTEATSLAVMALQSLQNKTVAQPLKQGIDWLIERQNPDGSWPTNDTVRDGSWSSALAMVCLSNIPGQEARAVKGAMWALTQEGRQFNWLTSLWIRLSGQRQSLYLNPELKGWAWCAGAFSWIEPTSYFLIALKKLRSSLARTSVEQRIRQGEALIYDRMCEGGGWNYGNAKILGETLWPYPDVTAVALIALQENQGIEPNNRSVEALQRMLHNVNSGFALSWSIICLSLYGYDVSSLRRTLTRRFEESKFLGETKTVALSVLALHGGGEFFRIRSPYAS